MIEKIIRLLSNEYLKAMLFGFFLIVMTEEYIDVLIVRILMVLIAVAIAVRPVIDDADLQKNKIKKEKK